VALKKRSRIPWRRIAILLAVCVVILAVVLPVRLVSSSASDLWDELKADMEHESVRSVVLTGPGPREETLTGMDCQRAVDAFLTGVFAEDNPNDLGPTAAIVASFELTQSGWVNANQWPDGRFEVQYKDRQFLVGCPQFASILRSRGFF
jgi:hypothetical protein